MDIANLSPDGERVNAIAVTAVSAAPGKLDGALEKLRTLKQLYIPHPEAKRVLEALERLRQFGSLGLEEGSPARCLLLTGESGSGKTALLRRWLRGFKVESTPHADRREVLYIEVPPRCTPKSLAENMLRGLGLPETLASRGTQVMLLERVKHHLRHQQTRLVVFDEMQHLIDTKNHKVIHDAADFVKSLLNAGICPFVLSGMPAANRIFEENEQLRRRAFGQFSLERFNWNSQLDQAIFAAVLVAYEQHLPFGEMAGLCQDKDTVFRIHRFSEGLVGRALDFLFAASARGVDEGATCLTHDILKKTAEDFRAADPDWLNPFACDLEVLEAAPPPPAPTRITRLRKGKRQVKQKDVLPR